MQEEPPSFLPISSFDARGDVEPPTTSPIGLSDDWLSPELANEANFPTQLYPSFAAPKPIKVEESEPQQDETPNQYFSEPNSPLIPAGTATFPGDSIPTTSAPCCCCCNPKRSLFVLNSSHNNAYHLTRQGRSCICTLLCCLMRLLPDDDMFLKTFLPMYLPPKELFKVDGGIPVHTNLKSMEFMDWCFPVDVLDHNSPLNCFMCMYIKMMQHVILQLHNKDVYEEFVLPEIILRYLFPIHRIITNGYPCTADYRSESQVLLNSDDTCDEDEEPRFELHMECKVPQDRVFQLLQTHAGSSCLGLMVIGGHTHLVVSYYENAAVLLFDPHGKHKVFVQHELSAQLIDVYFVKQRF
eukprot:PhF_6_TR14941/c0_g1_i1/m.23414